MPFNLWRDPQTLYFDGFGECFYKRTRKQRVAQPGEFYIDGVGLAANRAILRSRNPVWVAVPTWHAKARPTGRMVRGKPITGAHWYTWLLMFLTFALVWAAVVLTINQIHYGNAGLPVGGLHWNAILAATRSP